MQVNGVDMDYSTPLTWTVLRHIHMTTGDAGIQIISATLMDEWREVANC